MSGKKLTIALTADQQKQIRDATGKIVSEINLDGSLSDLQLDKVAGGASKPASFN
jgi:hypothetical protein